MQAQRKARSREREIARTRDNENARLRRQREGTTKRTRDYDNGNVRLISSLYSRILAFSLSCPRVLVAVFGGFRNL